MARYSRIEAGDLVLIQAADAALAEAVRKSGEWLVCRPGCTPCCKAPFAINTLDATRLRRGLAELESSDAARAAAIRERARRYLDRIRPVFPGDAATGRLEEDGEDAFPNWTDDDPCPALDPGTGTCDLYAARPMTCRIFGPATRLSDGAFGACELCYQGASDGEIASCAVDFDPDGREAVLVEALEAETGKTGNTLVAFALLDESNSAG